MLQIILFGCSKKLKIKKLEIKCNTNLEQSNKQKETIRFVYDIEDLDKIILDSVESIQIINYSETKFKAEFYNLSNLREISIISSPNLDWEQFLKKISAFDSLKELYIEESNFNLYNSKLSFENSITNLTLIDSKNFTNTEFMKNFIHLRVLFLSVPIKEEDLDFLKVLKNLTSFSFNFRNDGIIIPFSIEIPDIVYTLNIESLYIGQSISKIDILKLSRMKNLIFFEISNSELLKKELEFYEINWHLNDLWNLQKRKPTLKIYDYNNGVINIDLVSGKII